MEPGWRLQTWRQWNPLNASLRYCSHRLPLLWWEFFPKRENSCSDWISPLWTQQQGKQLKSSGADVLMPPSCTWFKHSYFQAAELIPLPPATLPRRLSYMYVFLSRKTLCGALGHGLWFGGSQRSVALDGWLRREEDGDFKRDDKGSDKGSGACCIGSKWWKARLHAHKGHTSDSIRPQTI